MLKLTYTAAGVTLERSDEKLEIALRRRVLLGLRVGEPVGLEPTVITLRVNRSAASLQPLRNTLLQKSVQPSLKLIEKGTTAELHLQGYWLGQPQGMGEGVFLLSLAPALEANLIELWQSQTASTPSTTLKLTPSL